MVGAGYSNGDGVSKVLFPEAWGDCRRAASTGLQRSLWCLFVREQVRLTRQARLAGPGHLASDDYGAKGVWIDVSPRRRMTGG